MRLLCDALVLPKRSHRAKEENGKEEIFRELDEGNEYLRVGALIRPNLFVGEEVIQHNAQILTQESISHLPRDRFDYSSIPLKKSQ